MSIKQSFEDISVDSTAEKEFLITSELIDNFASLVQDYNPIHINQEYAVDAGYKARIFHGAGLIGFVSSVVANNLPGEGSIILSMDSKFTKPAYEGDCLSVILQVVKKYKLSNTVKLKYLIKNQDLLVISSGFIDVLIAKLKT